MEQETIRERDGVAVGIPAGKAPVTLVGTGVQRHQGEGPSLLGQIGREQRLGFLPAHRGGGGIVGFVPCVVVGRCVCAGVPWGGITGGIGGVVGGLVVIGRGLRVLRVVWGGGPVRRGRGPPPGRLLRSVLPAALYPSKGLAGCLGCRGRRDRFPRCQRRGPARAARKTSMTAFGRIPSAPPGRRSWQRPTTSTTAAAAQASHGGKCRHLEGEAVGERGGEEEAEDLLQSWLARASLRESGGSTQREVIWV